MFLFLVLSRHCYDNDRENLLDRESVSPEVENETEVTETNSAISQNFNCNSRLITEQNEQIGRKIWIFLCSITVEPCVFLFVFAWGIIGLLKTNLFLDKVSRYDFYLNFCLQILSII